MKIIDLLNKIVNGEIDINNKYQFTRGDYCTINEFFDRYIIDEQNLNLEIIGTKKPEKLDISGGISVVNCAYKINEIIDYLKNKGEK